MIMMKRAIGFLYQTERGQTHGETERERRDRESKTIIKSRLLTCMFISRWRKK
jgi:hypothetical protein